MQKLPSFFIGHGSPMNAIESNPITKSWSDLGLTLGSPKAILVISAHWYISELCLSAQSTNQTIHDFYGFPEKLANYEYPSHGSVSIANEISKLLANHGIKIQLTENIWGLDHGAWSVLTHMFPKPQIPILQLSIPNNQPPAWHFKLGEMLKPLRENNILIIGSGNIVHNLGMLDWHKPNSGYDWAISFDQYIVKSIQARNFDAIINYNKFGHSAQLAIPTLDHFLPLLYILGLIDNEDSINIFNQYYQYGSLSMTSVRVG